MHVQRFSDKQDRIIELLECILAEIRFARADEVAKMKQWEDQRRDAEKRIANERAEASDMIKMIMSGFPKGG